MQNSSIVIFDTKTISPKHAYVIKSQLNNSVKTPKQFMIRYIIFMI